MEKIHALQQRAGDNLFFRKMTHFQLLNYGAQHLLNFTFPEIQNITFVFDGQRTVLCLAHSRSTIRSIKWMDEWMNYSW